jgi:Fe-S-cluster-containing hydrogenase component 2
MVKRKDMIVEIFGRKLEIVEDESGTCKRCALSDICPFGLMPCKDSKGNVNRRFERVKDEDTV